MAKTELEDAGEEVDDMITSTSKLREMILGMTGVDIMLDENTFKSTYQILKEIAPAYKELSDIEQASLLETLAGKNRANVLASILQNADVLENAYTTSINSAGSATKEYETYLDSIEGKLNSLRANYEVLSEDILNSDLIKDGLDIANDFVETIDKLIDGGNALIPILTALSGAILTKSNFGTGVKDWGVNFFGDERDKEIQIFNRQMNQVLLGFVDGKKGMDDYIKGMNTFKNTLYEASKAANVFIESGNKLFNDDGSMNESYWIGTNNGAQEHVINEIIGQLSDKGSHSISAQDLNDYFNTNTEGLRSSLTLIRLYNQELDSVTEATERKTIQDRYATITSLGHNKAMENAIKTGKTGKALYAAYAKELVGLKVAEIGATIATQALNAAISFGVSALASVLVSAISHAANASKELAEAGAEAAESYKSSTDQLQELVDKYEKLSKQLEATNLTDKQRYDIRSNILDVQNEIVDKYGEEANHIDLVNGRLNEQLEILQTIKATEGKDYLADSEANIDKAIKALSKRHNNGSNAAGMISTIAANDYGINLYTGQASWNLLKDVDIISDMEKFREIVESVGLTYTDYGQGYVGVDATDKTDTETIEAWRELSTQLANFEPASEKFAKRLQAFRNQISKEISDLNDETYQHNLQIVEQMVQATIATGTNQIEELGYSLLDFQSQLIQAQNDYKEATLTGDKEAIVSAAGRISELQSQLSQWNPEEGTRDSFIKAYFEKIFNDYQHVLDVDRFKAVVDGDVKQIADYIESKGQKAFSGRGGLDVLIGDLFSLVGEGNEVDEIGLLSAINDVDKQGTQAYKHLESVANEYKLSVEEVIRILAQMGWFTANAVNSVSISTKNYTTLIEESKEAADSVNKFASAMDKLKADSETVFTKDEINELIALYPQLLNKVEVTAKGYKVSYNDLANAQDSFIKEEKARIQEEIKDNEEQIKLLEDNIKAAEKEGSAVTVTGDKVSDAKKKVKSLNTENEQLLFLQEQLGLVFDDTSSKVEKLTDAYKGALDAVSKLASEQNKFGSLSGESVLDFITSYPDDWQKFIEFNKNSKSFTYTGDSFGENIYNVLKEMVGYDPNEKLKELQTAQSAYYASTLGGGVKAYEAATKVADKYGITVEQLGEYIEETKLETEAWQTALNLVEKEISATGAYDKYANAIEKINQAYENGEINASEKTNQIRQAGIDYTSGLEEEGLSGTTSATEAAQEVVSNEVNAIIDSYNEAVADADHQLNMGIISQTTHDNMIAGANSKMIATAQSMGYINNKAIQDQIKSNEESVYQARKTATENEYNNEKEMLDNLLADHEINGKEYQRRWKELNEKYWGNGTLLGSNESGIKTYESNLRDISAYSLDIVEKTQSDIKNLYDEGKIDVYEYWSRYAEAAQEIKDIPALSEDYESMMRTYFKDGYEEMYSETMDKAERAYDQGEISLTEYLNKCRKAYKKYYKDQTQFAKEALEAEQAMRDAYLNEIGQQIDYLQKLSEQEAKLYQQRIDAIDKLQEKVDKEFDAEIKALETRKEALEEENEELDRQVTQEERLKELRDAQAATAKANLRTRLVYENGHFVAKRDENAYQEALANEKKAQNEVQKGEREQKINELDGQINTLQNQKEAADEDFENQKQFFQDIIDELQEPYNQIIGVLEDIRDESSVTNVDPNFISTLLQSETGKQLLSDRHEVGQIYNELATQYGQDAIAQMSAEEIAQKVGELAARKNKTADEVAKKLGYVGISDSSITPEDKKKIDNVLTFFSPNTSGTTVNKSSGVKQNEDVLSKMGNQSNYLSPTITINVQGNADKSTISQMKTMLTQTLTDYTNRVTAAMNSAFTKTATVV